MAAELSLDSKSIEDLAGQINEAISGVMNVDQILKETADDVQKAGDLKARAEQVLINDRTKLIDVFNLINDKINK
jgi:hypothetical protein